MLQEAKMTQLIIWVASKQLRFFGIRQQAPESN